MLRAIIRWFPPAVPTLQAGLPSLAENKHPWSLQVTVTKVTAKANMAPVLERCWRGVGVC